MHTVIVTVVIAGVAVAGFASLMAFQPAWPLGDFRPGHQVRDRHFEQPPTVVIDAYRRAVLLTPGIVIVDAEPDVLYLEVRRAAVPTPSDRALVLRLTFLPGPDGGTTVRTCAQRWARRRNHMAPVAVETAEVELSTRVIDRGLAWRLAGL